MSKRVRAKRSRLRSLTAALSTTLLVIALGVGAAQPANASPASLCDFGYFVAVRGSNEAPGQGTSLDGNVYSGFGSAQGGFGYGSLDLMRVAINYDNLPFYTSALVYPANADASYPVSLATGRNNLVNHLNWVAQKCYPYLPAVVLGGYSQGANVIEDALVYNGAFPNLTAEAKGMIRAVALFGSPTYVAGQPYDAPGSGPKNGIFPRDASTLNQLASYRTWGWPPGGSSQGWVYRIRSLCYNGDFFCQNNWGDTNYAIHRSYAPNGAMYDAWQWAKAMLNVY